MSDSPSDFCPDCGRPVPKDAPQGLCPRCLLSEAATDPGTALESVIEPTGSSEPSHEQVATAFPWLDILERLGEGGMGVVYKARQRKLDRMVALKILRCPKEQEAHFAERFLREARALAKLNHPHIVTVFDFGESQGLYYLIMEYVDGVSLRQAMGGGRLSPEEALRIVPVVCQALQIAHDHGILHRDIKPANILLSRDGTVKMADFGLAKFVDEERDPSQSPELLTRTESSLGTPAYMAPEQTTDPSRVDHRADIYSLGVVFYEMLTGELPLGRFPAPSSRSTVDQRVDEVVLRTLEREPQERYQTAKEMQTDVEDLGKPEEAPPISVPPEPPSQPSPARKNPSTVSPETSLPSPMPPSRFSWLGLVGAILVFASLPAILALITQLTELSAQRPAELPSAHAIAYSLTSYLGQNVSIYLAIIGTLLGWFEALRMRHHPFASRGTLLVVFAALAWPILLVITWVYVFADSWSQHSLHIPAVLLFLSLPAVFYTVARFRRWLLNTPKAQHWYWAYAFVIFYLPFYPVFHKSLVKQRHLEFPMAVLKLDPATMESHLANGQRVDLRTAHGDTALTLTTWDQDLQKSRLLISYGADVNVTLPDGNTPLLMAARNGHTEMLKLLIQNGADIHATLQDEEHRFNALHLAAQYGHASVIDHLLDFGLSADSRDSEGRTALMLAAWNGHHPVLEELLSKHAEDSINLTDVQGNTALDHAVASGQTYGERLLLSRGANRTTSYLLRGAFTFRSQGWGTVIEQIQKAQAAMVPNHPTLLRFGFDGWWYRFEQPELSMNAMLVEAAARASRPAIAKGAVKAAEENWPEAGEDIALYQRQDRPSLPMTVQVLHLQKSDLDYPLRSSQHRTNLTGWSRTQGVQQVGSGSLNSSTFFR